MKYLLQAIQAQRARIALSDNELRQLITDVQRGRDSREEFLESIERVLSELRGYTEHSAAFLAKVSKRDAPDYYDVIKHPMDLGTMQKKIKVGGYKNKRQFAHDLDLIWDNCLVYNSDPSHPLRRNVHFMRKKANHLLNYVHDKNDVNDALREWEVVQRSWVGTDNAPAGANNAGVLVPNEATLDIRSSVPSADIPFEQRPALLRDPYGMASFTALDKSLAAFERETLGTWPDERPHHGCGDAWNMFQEQQAVAGPSRLPIPDPRPLSSPLNGPLEEESIRTTLKALRMQGPFHMALTTATVEQPEGDQDGGFTPNDQDSGPPEPSSSSSGSSSPGLTPAKLNGKPHGMGKRTSHAGSAAKSTASIKGKEKETFDSTVIIPSPFDTIDQQSSLARSGRKANIGPGTRVSGVSADASRVDPQGLVGSWWDSIVSNDLIANGVPALPRSTILTPAEHQARVDQLRRRQNVLKRKLAPPSGQGEEELAVNDPRRLKRIRNRVPESIKSLQKLRRTHMKLGLLAHANANNEDVPEWLLADSASEEESDEEDDLESRAPLRQDAAADVFSNSGANPCVRISPHAARERLLHVTRLLMAHHGLQGSTKAPMEALASMGMNAISNLGRALRNYSDRYAHKMSSEDMVKHVLREVTNTDVPGLEGHIRHSVERHCGRVLDLLRKVKVAYDAQLQQTTERNAVQHEAMFDDGAEALMAGNFADEIGDDFFGFKELGLDQEFGIGGLSVPARLFHGRGRAGGANSGPAGLGINGTGTGKNAADLLPYVPPEPFVLLDSQGVSAQIGLLQPFFRERLREHKRIKSRAKEEVTQAEMDHLLDDEEMIVGPESRLKNLKVPPTGKLPKRRMWVPRSRGVASGLSLAKTAAGQTKG
ncbi:hypothetical protein K437DRAFT_294137 [Tilletiaria anomala UBC 951]|uniref:Bromo domain-containing protein n=1 Tax=Tilletiaria anomala (strain ATCC 24038 / CBS 436.72 / UBC 951) TaxID=1037660 RepID=A0A066W068_TILAU|nr:uncharacterized protein K437DRAFT_294137 [Tilletiaria anomala UBC 951]KDN47146.1 hypothetical protein K437DRAFT_294137 [Tilletiaria anomala UBC 951]